MTPTRSNRLANLHDIADTIEREATVIESILRRPPRNVADLAKMENRLHALERTLSRQVFELRRYADRAARPWPLPENIHID